MNKEKLEERNINKRDTIVRKMAEKEKKQNETKKIEGKSEKQISKKNQLIVIIRISGMVKIRFYSAETLHRLRLRRKYSCVLSNPNDNSAMGALDKVKFFVAYGDISKETLVKLLTARGQKIDKKEFNAEEVAEQLINGKKLKELGFKPFFRLHPPRKGINSKLQYPKGVLGNNKEDINKLIERML